MFILKLTVGRGSKHLLKINDSIISFSNKILAEYHHSDNMHIICQEIVRNHNLWL